MKINWLIFIFLSCFAGIASGQNISGREADSLLHLLKKTKTGVARIDLLLQYAEYHILKPGEYKQDLDSAVALIEEAGLINKKINSVEASGYITLVNSYLAKEKGQKDSAQLLVSKAIQILEKSKDFYHLGQAQFELNLYYEYGIPEQLTKKIRLVESAVQSYRQSGHLEKQANSLEYLADLYQLNNETSKSLQTIDLCLQIYKLINYPKLYGVYVLYASNYLVESNYKQALKYYLLALSDIKKNGDSSMSLCQINNCIGITLLQLKENEKAIGYFQTALRVAEKHEDSKGVMQLAVNLVHNYIQLKKPEEALQLMQTLPKKFLEPTSQDSYIFIPLSYMIIYFDLKKYDEVQKYSNELLELIKTHRPQVQSLKNLYYLHVRYYLETKQFKAAKQYLGKLDSLSQITPEPARIRENYFLHFRLDTALGNYKSAVANLLEYQKRNDSIFNETSNKQIKQLEVEFETEKKEQNIQLLEEKGKVQQSKLLQAKYTRDWILSGVALLLVIMGLLIYNTKLKQKTNRKLEAQQTEIAKQNLSLRHLLNEKEWLIKEIHHRVKNNFQTVMGLLGTQSEYLKNEAAINAIADSQRRIHSMSLIHQRLYQADNLSAINMKGYIHELVDYLSESFDTGNKIRIQLSIESIEMDLAHCIPLGLILNEAITNSYKYAFPNQQDGTIQIVCRREPDDFFSLTIQDNGKGLPPEFSTHEPHSMGMNLMKGLSEEIDATFKISNHHGTLVELKFEYHPDIIIGISKTKSVST